MTWSAFRHYGPVARARFDHHLPPPRVQDRAILYAAADGVTCVAEVFQRRRVVDRMSAQPWLVGFELQQQITLVDLTGFWPTKIGASMAIASGPRPRARRWSQRFYDFFPEVQGLWYPSSMAGNKPAVALYERAKGAIPQRPSIHRPLADPALLPALQRACSALGYALR